jgi:hypothetical protein
MKRSIVPAQITTVEDKVLGNLTPQQAGLISVPLVLGVLFYVVLPAHFHLELYKIVIIVGLELVGAILSIRINDQMLAFWVAMKVNYNLRPRYYIYNKNDPYLRHVPAEPSKPKNAATLNATKVQHEAIPEIEVQRAVLIEEMMADERVNLRFKTTKKGRLHVVTNEIK